MNQAVCGESAALSIGLVMASTGNEEVIQEMFQYAHETEHEKIIRSISICLALIQFSREQEADGTINQLLFDKDPILRAGGCYTIGMAYVGTSNNSAVKKLLNYAVNDVSDDVRRAAVISLAFVMFKQYE
jgi:26S proteasome regulatory subunit N2